MCMKAILSVNITEIEGKSINIYTKSETTENNQMFGNADNIYVKQADVNDILGYTCNTKSNFSGHLKCQDLSTRSYNFIPLCLVIDYLDSLPSTGERRKNSRTLESYITKITSIFRSSYNPINDIKGSFDAAEPQEPSANQTEVQKLKNRIDELVAENAAKQKQIRELTILMDSIMLLTKETYNSIRKFKIDHNIENEEVENESC